jgi:hypothetical protein
MPMTLPRDGFSGPTQPLETLTAPKPSHRPLASLPPPGNRAGTRRALGQAGDLEIGRSWALGSSAAP